MTKPSFYLKALCLQLCVAAPAFAQTDWQLSSDLLWSQQSFAELAAQQQTQLQLSSLWQADNWDARISVPLLQTDSGYHIQPGKTPRLCTRIQNAGDKKLARWISKGRISAATIANCQAQPVDSPTESASGLGDIFAEANRYWTIGEATEANLGLGFKAASGDEEDNLGTGRESAYLLAGLASHWGDVTGGLAAELTQHLGTGLEDEHDTQQSLNAHFDWQLQEHWTLGVFSYWQSAAFEDDDDLTSVGLSAGFTPIKSLRLSASYEKFQTNSQDLDSTTSAGLRYSW